MNAHSNITSFVKSDRSNYRYWQIRDNAAVRALSTDDRNLVLAAIQRHNDRIDTDWRPIATRNDYVAVLTRQVSALVYPLVDRLYRTDVSGSTRIRIQIGAPHASGYTTNNWDVYSKRTRYPAKDAHLEVSVMHGWRRHVGAVEGLATAGGMLTTHAKRVGDNAWKASWITQGRGVDLNVQHGYIVGAGEEWAHAKTLASAQRMLRQRQAAAEAEAEAARQANAARMATHAEFLALYGDMIVTAQDSLAAGNCPSGTRSWIERHFPGRTEATVAEVMAVPTLEYYVRRAVNAAIARHHQ